MKYLLIMAMLAFNANTFAGKAPNNSLRTSVSYDEKTMSIQIDDNRKGHRIHFDQTFDVSNMGKVRKEVIKFRAFNSVGMMPPLHEIPCLSLSAVGLLLCFLALVVRRFSGRLLVS